MFIVSITPNDVRRGDNPCTVYYNYGGTGFPEKLLTIESTSQIFFVENNKNKKQLYWKEDDAHTHGFKHEVLVKVRGNFSDGDVIKVSLEETDKWGHKIQSYCVLHYKA